MARKFAVSSSKGGVGKTFCCANLGAALADIGQKVLLIDTDRQQSLSKYYPIKEKAQNGLREMVLNGSSENCISSTVYPNLDIVINNDYDEDVKTWVSKSPVSRMLYLTNPNRATINNDRFIHQNPLFCIIEVILR